jgi:predicted DNA-binding transcriptional regulator YafY
VDRSLISPTAKALRTLELLQARPGITADDLADRLAVSDRAVRRYVAILREAGVPVDSLRGRHGGYRVGRSLQPPPMLFSASEALGLVMAVLDGHHAAADVDDPVGSALGKLIRSLPEHTGRQAAAVRAHALAAPDRRAVRPDPTITSLLVEAVAERRGVRISYASESGATVDTRADPWAVVVRHGRWYLLCFAHTPAAPRAYRIDRIDAVTTLNVDIDAPDDLDPVTYLEQHLGSGWPYETHVEFEAPTDVIAPLVGPPMGRLEPVDDTRCVLHGTTNNPTMYAGEWLAAIPHRFRVLGGPELRRAVHEIGHRMIAAVDGAAMPPDAHS